MTTPLHLLFSHDCVATRPVCIDGDHMLDWRFFTERTCAAVRALGSERHRHSTRWALCLSDPFEFACGLFALLAAGKQIVLPSNHKPAALLPLAGLYDSVLDDLDGLLANGAGGPCAKLRIDPRAPLSLVTSGSSGVPKVIQKTLAQFEAEIHTLATLWGTVMRGVTVVASVPHHHIYGLLFRLLWPLAAGQPFDRMTCVEPADVRARLAALQNTVLVSSPAQLTRWPSLINLTQLTPPPGLIFSSGGPLPAETAAIYTQAFGAAPIEVYGSTETGGIAWRCQPQATHQNEVSDAWTPMPAIDVRCDTEGALQLRSPHLPDDQWWRMEDAVQIEADGRFRLRGRLDRIIKLEEKRVSLPELEHVLMRHPWVKQAAVAPLNGARMTLGALLTLTEEGIQAWRSAASRRFITQALRRYLAEYFDGVVLPRHWRFCMQLPFDERGKLSVTQLATRFATHPLQPEVLAEWCDDNTALLELHVPATLIHFSGHFPGLPILPGVVQIDWVVRYAAHYFARCNGFQTLEQIKFLSMVRPGTTLRLALAHDPERARITFRYYVGERDYATGRIVYSKSAVV
ncbi:AMP-binding protein [Mycoavidus cysteinexigens]|nr:AMP-binding protein [Mycoavidus cysteinexigens]